MIEKLSNSKKSSADKKHRIYEVIQSIKDAIYKVFIIIISENLIKLGIMHPSTISKIKIHFKMNKFISCAGFLVRVLIKRFI